MGQRLLDVDRVADAISAYQKAVAIEPRNYSAWHGLGRAYLSTRQYAMAVEAYKEATRYTSNLYVWHDLADAYAQACELEEARRLHRTLLEAHPNDGIIPHEIFGGHGLESFMQEMTEKCITRMVDDAMKNVRPSSNTTLGR